MRRIGLAVVLTISFVLAPLIAEAQPARTPRIGWLGNGSANTNNPFANAFRQGLRELGYVEGSSLVIEYRFADGKSERLPALVAELLRVPVDILVMSGPEAARAAQRATRVVPIVVAVMHEPVAYGLIASFARPGGNVTGLAFQESELVTKQLELLHEAFPRVSRVAVLHDPSGGGPFPLEATERAARARGAVSPRGNWPRNGRDGAELAAAGLISAPRRPTDRPGVRTVPRDRRVPKQLGGVRVSASLASPAI